MEMLPCSLGLPYEVSRVRSQGYQTLPVARFFVAQSKTCYSPRPMCTFIWNPQQFLSECRFYTLPCKITVILTWETIVIHIFSNRFTLFNGAIDIFKIFRLYVAKRQKRKPKWRKNKICFIKTQYYFLSFSNSCISVRHSASMSCDDFCVSRPDGDHSFDRKCYSDYVLIKNILFFLHFSFRFCLFASLFNGYVGK